MAKSYSLKKIKPIVFYLFIILSCLLGAFLADNIVFEKEIIFVAYVAAVIYAIFEVIFKGIPFVRKYIVFLRIAFLAACSVISFVLLRTPEEMILKNELKTPIEYFKMADAGIKPGTGYLVDMKLEMSNEQLSDLIDRLGYKKISLEEYRSYNIKTKNIQDVLRGNTSTILFFIKDETRNSYGPRDTKYLTYDTQTMTAYYEHLNNKGWD